MRHASGQYPNKPLTFQTNVLVAWLVSLVYSSALVAASSCSVVFGAPAAAGAGVAEVMAFLNGVRIPKVCLVSCTSQALLPERTVAAVWCLC